MLGRKIIDPEGVEGGGAGEGFGLLDVTTVLKRNKITEQVLAQALHLGQPGLRVNGYFIHAGRTQRHGHRPCFQLHTMDGQPGAIGEDGPRADGAANENGLVWGSYIHGLFDGPAFRRAWLNRLRNRKGLTSLSETGSLLVNERRRAAFDRWADHVAQHLAIGSIVALANRSAKP